VIKVELKTIFIIGIVLFALYWLHENKPDMFNSGVDLVKTQATSVYDKFTDDQQQAPSDKTQSTDTTDINTVMNYGKPQTPFECSSDVQCRVYFNDVPDIKCNMATGECYTEV